MAKEIDPRNTTRAKAFEMWMNAPNPMVTFFKTLDVTNLVKTGKRRRLEFNMHMPADSSRICKMKSTDLNADEHPKKGTK